MPIEPELFGRAENRRGTSSTEAYTQPFINMRVDNLIREIQEVRPNFRYSTIRPTGQPYGQTDIEELNRTIAPLRSELLSKLPDLNPAFTSQMSLGQLNDQVQYKTYLANGGKAAFTEWATECNGQVN
jgi:hypothetical protein